VQRQHGLDDYHEADMFLNFWMHSEDGFRGTLGVWVLEHEGVMHYILVEGKWPKGEKTCKLWWEEMASCPSNRPRLSRIPDYIVMSGDDVILTLPECGEIFRLDKDGLRWVLSKHYEVDQEVNYLGIPIKVYRRR